MNSEKSYDSLPNFTAADCEFFSSSQFPPSLPHYWNDFTGVLCTSHSCSLCVSGLFLKSFPVLIFKGLSGYEVVEQSWWKDAKFSQSSGISLRVMRSWGLNLNFKLKLQGLSDIAVSFIVHVSSSAQALTTYNEIRAETINWLTENELATVLINCNF